MAQTRLGVSGVVFPQPDDTDKKGAEMKFALEEFVQKVEDNITHLLLPPSAAVTGTYTARELDKVILADATGGAFTVTLPVAETVKGLVLTVKKIDAGANAVTVDGDGSETIDGATTYALSSQYKFVTVYSDGVEWWVISNN